MASEAELGQLKERARGGWDRANYAPLAERLMPVALDLVDACAISAGQDVLDVAAGNGNLALLAARAWKALASVALTAMSLTAISVAVCGWETIPAFLQNARIQPR